VAWQPVLRSELARAARAAVAEIAAEIDRVPDAHKVPIDLALFWAYAAGAFDDDASATAFDAASSALVGHINSGAAGPLALHDGLAGAGWVLSHISDGALGGLSALDDLFAGELDRPAPWPRDYDLISGLAGYAVYFLERLAGGAPRAAIGLQRIVEHLRSLAITDHDGTTWFTPVSILSPSGLLEAPNGRYDCGVAHGVPGVVAVLARIAGDPAVDETTAAEARRLATGALGWMHARMGAPHLRGRFAPWILPPGEVSPGLAAGGWCYGEPGVDLALWTAAQRLGQPVDAWRELARDSARRPAEACDINTPGLCHGAVGLAHLFNRCYQATHEPVFADAVNHWIERTLAMRIPGTGPGGFTLSGDGTASVASQQLLYGATGIGLGLLAALGTAEPGWDRLLACDLPIADDVA
jgi:hypothetical protein